MSWAERAVDRSPAVERSRSRTRKQARLMLDAARRLIAVKGDAFTTEELAREAGVALRTFYRYFASKDALLLAVIGDVMEEWCGAWTQDDRAGDDPLQRLRMYIGGVFDTLDGEGGGAATARFIVGAHWRLHPIFPAELAEAERPFVELMAADIRAAAALGLVSVADAEARAWLIVELTRAVYHFYANAPGEAANREATEELLWQFVLNGLRDDPHDGPHPG